MKRARVRGPIDGYVERHHIKPKSLFPELRDDPDNIVMLTAREHFVAHLLLAKIYGGVMSFAAQSMSLNGRYGSRSYEWLREEAASYLSTTRQGEGNPMFGRKQTPDHIAKSLAGRRLSWGGRPSPLKGRSISDEHRENISAFMRENGAYWSGRKHSAETVEKMRSITKERMKDPEVRRHLSEINTGKVVSDDVRAKISAATRGIPKPLRSDEHRRNIAEANRRNGERSRARYLKARRPSATMLRIAEVLDIEGSMVRSEICRRIGLSLEAVVDSLDRMEQFSWVEYTSRRAARVVFGRTEQRFYELTQTGEVELRAKSRPPQTP